MNLYRIYQAPLIPTLGNEEQNVNLTVKKELAECMRCVRGYRDIIQLQKHLLTAHKHNGCTTSDILSSESAQASNSINDFQSETLTDLPTFITYSSKAHSGITTHIIDTTALHGDLPLRQAQGAPLLLRDQTMVPIQNSLTYECPTCKLLLMNAEEMHEHMLCHQHIEVKKEPAEDVTYNEEVLGSQTEPATLTGLDDVGSSVPTDMPSVIQRDDIGPLACLVCNYVYYTLDKLRFHGRRHGLLLCTLCGQHCVSLGKLIEHSNTHLNQPQRDLPFTCLKCGMGLSSETKLKAHSMSHDRVFPSNCEKCDKTMLDMFHYFQHNLLHEEEECSEEAPTRGTVETEALKVPPTKPCMAPSAPPIACQLCGSPLASASGYALHMKSEHKRTTKQDVKCEACLKPFSGYGYLVKHIRGECEVPVDKLYKCSHCTQSFQSVGMLDVHMLMLSHQQHTPKLESKYSTIKSMLLNRIQSAGVKKESKERVSATKVKCSVCGDLFLTTHLLLAHLINSHGYLKDHLQKAEPHVTASIPTVACQLCGSPLASASGYALHMKRDHKRTTKQDVKCEACLKRFSGYGHVVKHVREECKVPVDTLYTCLHCMESFQGIARLNMHMLSHKGSDKACGLCEETFTQDAELESHLLENHTDRSQLTPEGKESEQGLSKSVTETTAPKSDFIKPMRRQQKEKPVPCDICGFISKNIYYMYKHRSVHSEVKPYLCDMCGYSTNFANALRKHIKIHKFGKRHACETCGFKFFYKCSLRKHQRVHNNIRPFPCTSCSKAFKTKTDLTQHMKFHMDIRPFPCPVCGRAFHTAQNMRTHAKIHDKRQRTRKKQESEGR